ncbi:class F sortase [Candidatus Saccharibacteria bacterium]|nr:class F sortase [Candidatus Saccharibacteria bacterium]
MGLKISKKENQIVKIVFFVALGIVILLLIKIMIWENWYYQSKSSSIRTPEQSVITGIADASTAAEDEISQHEYDVYQVAALYPRYLEIDRLNLKARVEGSNVNENSMPLPNNIHDVCWYSGSGRPGEGGTVLISGIKRGIRQTGAFANLDSLEKGDIATIIRGDGARISYEIQEISIIDREKLKDELPTAQKRLNDKETLSLITANRANIISDFTSVVLIRATKK